MRKLTEKDVDFELTVGFDDLQVRGNAMASGDDALDKKVEDEIIARLDDGDVWAWAQVTVTARWEDFDGHDYLGACSYKDEADFKQKGGYWESMKAQALDDLNKNVLAAKEKIDTSRCKS